MIIINNRMYEANKFHFGGGTPKAPKPPSPPPDPNAAASNVRSDYDIKNKMGRSKTILAGDTLGGSPASSTKKTLLGM